MSIVRRLLRRSGPLGATGVLSLVAVAAGLGLAAFINLSLQRPPLTDLALVAPVLVILAPLMLYPALRALAKLVRAERMLEQVGSLDRVTGMLGRQRFQQEVEREIERGKRYGGQLSVVLFSLTLPPDPNEEWVERWFHHTGKRMRETSRSSDLWARWSEDEVAVLLPATGPREAMHMAERMRRLIALGPPLGTLEVKTAAGVSGFDVPTLDVQRLMQRAAEALRLGREAGAVTYR